MATSTQQSTTIHHGPPSALAHPLPLPLPLSIPITSTIVINPDLRHVELEIEKHLKHELDIKLDTDAQLCPRHLAHLASLNPSNPSEQLSVPPCQFGPSCPLRHSSPSALNFTPSQNNVNPLNGLHSKTVCKHWLRGLCKKGATCEFLHEYNLRTMPECWFFGKYGFCSNGDECMYLHVDERMRVLECMDFRRGFCPKGPACSQKHIRRPVCQAYIAGFCQYGKACLQGGHPKMEVDPAPRGNPYINSFNPFDRPRGDPDRGVGAPRGGMGGVGRGAGQPQMAGPNQKLGTEPFGRPGEQDDGWVQTDSGPRKKRNLDEVTCFKCGQRGHYANTCPNPMVPGNRGGVVRGPGGRLLGEEDVPAP